MAHSYTNILIHYVFSTKNREKIITVELQEQLWPYIGGIARENNMKALAIGGIEDHVHLLISLPTTLSIAIAGRALRLLLAHASLAIQLIKGGSSKWIHDTFLNYNNFKWQEGYGAFSVSISRTKDIIAYINTQNEHHFKKSFREEYVLFLKKNVIDYDKRYIWG